MKDLKNKENKQNKEIWWKPAVEIFTQVSGWIAGPIILALIAGKALDNHFGTKPFMFLGLTGVAFIASSFGIVRVVGKYMSRLSEESRSRSKAAEKEIISDDKKKKD